MQQNRNPATNIVLNYDMIQRLRMSFAFHGIGTMRYGKRDYWPDGSFVTTEWFVLAFIPLLPTNSKRIAYTTDNPLATYDAGGGYFVYELLPLDRRQVTFVYLWFLGFIAPFVIWGAIESTLTIRSRDWVGDFFLAFWVGWCLLPYFVQRIIKRRNARRWRRQALGLGG